MDARVARMVEKDRMSSMQVQRELHNDLFALSAECEVKTAPMHANVMCVCVCLRASC